MDTPVVLKRYVKPYIFPTKNQGGKVYAATIAAGFRCSNGVVLCADTEITLGAGKTYQSKIFVVDALAGCYLTYCGSTDFAKELVDDLRQIQGKGARDALAIIKSTYREFFGKYCNPDDEATWTSILITLRDGDKVNLYAGRGRQFPNEPYYATLGIGQYQSEALFNPLYHQWMTVNEAVYMAFYGLHSVKGFVPGCGGETEYVEILDDADVIPLDFLMRPSGTDIEQDFQFLARVFKPVLFAFPDMDISLEKFSQILREMETSLIQYRKRRIKDYEAEQKRLRGEF